MFSEAELNCTDCRCYNCNVVECGRSLCAGQVNAAHRTSFYDCFSSRCSYLEAVVNDELESAGHLPFLYAGDDDISEESEHDVF